MPNVSVGKLKLLHIMETLLLKTDENHKINTPQLLAMLREHDIIAERKSIYDDIRTLQEFGLEINYDSTAPGGYYLLFRTFELPEVKLLIDAVQAAKFITSKKTAQLIEKIEYLTNIHESWKLNRQVYAVKRIKSQNESIYYNIDAIHEAINNNFRISFEYLTWDLNKKLVPKCDSDMIISPWTLTWENEDYYMLGYDEESGIIKHYRIDKMRNVQLRKEKRNGQKAFDKLDMANFAIKTFGLFNGNVEKVTLECDNELIGVILDRFGTDVIIVPISDTKFQVSHEIAVSGHFFGWMVSLGPGARIVYPMNVVNEFKERLTKMI